MKNIQLSKSIEDYLEAIYILEKNENSPKSVEIARMLNVSKPAVNKAMNELLSLNYINKEPYGDIHLTSQGKEIAKKIYHTHITIRDFLLKLGVSKETAEKDCCLIEHVVSKETLNAIEKSLKEKK